MMPVANHHRLWLATVFFGAALLLGLVSNALASPTLEVLHSFSLPERWP